MSEPDVTSIGAAFLLQSRAYLSEEYLAKIHRAVEHLTDEQIWWRPNEASNSAANLILHLAGNVRQWIVAGIGGSPDVRRRHEEFDARAGRSRDDLLRVLEDAVRDACDVLATLDPVRLGERATIQGRDVTNFSAIYHVVEHFAGHTYQIAYIAKQISGEDLAYYEMRDDAPRPTWAKREPAEQIP